MSRFGHVLYWFMIVLGGLVLAPCVILPAWLEYRASLDLLALRQAQVTRTEENITRLRKQREHIETDDAYVLRLALETFRIEIPGLVRVPVQPGPEESAAWEEEASLEPPIEELAPELSAMVEQVLAQYPLAQVFVRPDTRPSLIFIGAGFVVTAAALLCVPRGRAS